MRRGPENMTARSMATGLRWEGGVGVGILVALSVVAIDPRWWPALVGTAFFAFVVDRILKREDPK